MLGFALPSFDTPDPLAEQFPHLSPYAHCAANPTGKELKPKGEEELQVIKNTIPAEARRFVVINDEGFINQRDGSFGYHLLNI